MEGNCKLCRFYVASTHEQNPMGTCQRNPPAAIPVQVNIRPSVANPKGGVGMGVQSFFPPVTEVMVCGMFALDKAIKVN